ncbi:MAG TPA: glycosyltransferase family 4 protein [Anaerolineales bacterium]|nr:glycosyltransferase family 4 protein [Anaerolineales bacterium]
MARRLCLASPIEGIAGPANFQRRLVSGLEARGYGLAFGLADRPYDAVLVSGGTRRLSGLRAARSAGIPVVQRLDGINWIHRRRRTGWRHFLRAEVNNWLLRATRQLADSFVYQSEFVRGWWERAFGVPAVPATVIHNGVPLDIYRPDGPSAPRRQGVRVLVLEARLAGGYEIGLEWAVALVSRVRHELATDVELAVAGEVPPSVQHRWQGEPITWLGRVAPDEVPALLRSADLLFASDLNPACPNSVIEAMACGRPILGFDTGALLEVVGPEAGRVVSYGGDPWRLEAPDIPALVPAGLEILERRATFRRAARRRAEDAFGLDRMVDAYLRVLGWLA